MFARLFIFCAIIFSCLKIGVEATLDLEVSLVHYRNPNSEDCEGSNCEGSFGTCDNLFTFCLRGSLSSDCTYGTISSTDDIEDDDFTFSTSVLSQIGLSDPIAFRNIVPSDPLVLEVQIDDEDLGTDDHVDTIIINFPRILNISTTSPTTSYRGTCRSTDQSVIDLRYTITSNCPLNRYGLSCERACIPQVGQYYCNYLGERVCQGTFTGSDCTQCIADYYGERCDIFCVPTGDFVCNEDGEHVCNGNFQPPECNVCLPNYFGPDCTVECIPRDDSSGHFSCNQDGSRECLRNFDRPDTGCLDCVTNYYGTDCNVQCIPQSSRFKCNDLGEMVCNGNYLLPDCTTCLPDYYGDTCTTFCVPQDNSNGHYNCNPTDGSRDCLRNFAGDFCTDCLDNYYTPECNVLCIPPTPRHICVEPGIIACNENFQLPDCMECLPDYYGDTCSVFCRTQESQYNCIPTPPYRQCLGNFAGSECTDCIGNFAGTDCTRCKTNYFADECSIFCESNSEKRCNEVGELVNRDDPTPPPSAGGGVGVGGYIGIGVGVAIVIIVCLTCMCLIGCYNWIRKDAAGCCSCSNFKHCCTNCCKEFGNCMSEACECSCDCCVGCVTEVLLCGGCK